MTDFRWFRLMIFSLGVYFAGSGAYEALYYGSYSFRDAIYMNQSPSAMMERVLMTLIMAIPAILKLGFGIYLIRGGGALTRWILKRVEHNCARCDYSLLEVKGNTCPECGLEFDSSKIQARKEA